jgi:PII-like signaling protein
MQIPRDAMLLGIFIDKNQHYQGKPLYESRVMKARELHLAGATVLRGPLGFGQSSHLHSAKILRLSENLPMVIEIVDSQPKIEELLGATDGMIASGLVTLEKVQVLQYGDGQTPS